jgi:uncharacterized LabA/DUF88 family protein
MIFTKFHDGPGGLIILGRRYMKKVVFMIDGWFMRKRIYDLKSFYYSGEKIREYCLSHIDKDNEELFRIFYYDTAPLNDKTVHPITGATVDFGASKTAIDQNKLLESIKITPNFALRLGHTSWRKGEWVLSSSKLNDLIKGTISVSDLKESDIKPAVRQKAVDMKIGLDIAWIATKRIADKLIIITGDADIVPALKSARKEGMVVVLDHLHNHIQPSLQEHVDCIACKIPKPTKP